LAKHGANLSTPDNAGFTPVYITLLYGKQLECFKILAKHGADLSTPNRIGQTLVWVASASGKLECLKILAKHGANLSTPSNAGETPVYQASGNGELECLRFLVKHGADLNTPKWNGATPVFHACEKGSLECVKFLAANGANLLKPLNANRNHTPYWVAKKNGHLDCANFVDQQISKGRGAKNLGKKNLTHNFCGKWAKKSVPGILHAEITKKHLEWEVQTASGNTVRCEVDGNTICLSSNDGVRKLRGQCDGVNITWQNGDIWIKLLKVGDRVKIVNIAKKEYEGLVGTIVKPFIQSKERWPVKLDQNDKFFNIARHNLELIKQANSGARKKDHEREIGGSNIPSNHPGNRRSARNPRR